MKIDPNGIVVELDPNSRYILVVKAGSLLSRTIHEHKISMEGGRILFVGSMDEFKFIKYNDNIIGVES